MKRAGSLGVAGRLVLLWPLVPFLGFGFCGAWFALANGTVWLSSVESNGGALTTPTVVVNVGTGYVLLVSFGLRRLLGARFERAVLGRGVALAAGVVGSAGSLLLILIGPAFFQQLFSGATFVLFQVAAGLIGVSFGVLFLRLGVLYGSLPLRRAILYLCYSYLVAVFIYLAVQVSPRLPPAAGSPSSALIVAFVALPLLAAASLCVDPAPIPWFDGTPAAAERPASPQDRGHGRLLARFCAALLLFGLVQSAVTSSVSNAAPPSATLGTYNLVMLAHVPLLLVFAALGSTLEARRLDLGRLCVVLVVLLEVLVVLALAVDVTGGLWVAAVRSIAFAFETLTWCLLFAVAGRRPERAFEVVSLGYGVYALGLGLGTLAGAWLPQPLGSVTFYIGCALLLLPAFLLLGEKGVDGLFGPAAPGVTALEGVLGDQLQMGEGRPKGEFSRRLEAFAAEHGLSAREAQTLRYLVAGRGDSQIAEAMGISYNTARTHVRNVYNKLGVHDRQTLIDVVDARLR